MCSVSQCEIIVCNNIYVTNYALERKKERKKVKNLTNIIKKTDAKWYLHVKMQNVIKLLLVIIVIVSHCK